VAELFAWLTVTHKTQAISRLLYIKPQSQLRIPFLRDR